ncbi:uncharacterized protein DUF262 [Paraburkholderia sp. BL18I3N2]|uniref:DUF262 domain-containing protein n=1 Tax=Paraburkholderia sp. BL18I3N2 TaxID=1938799 RepID=UPI000D49C422|nr:DUF262 domain-containing protein [Paraburkholderia sp. BL18I3N2]PRX34398.1 uncharacterized protein DUF262 [Paraburkholderia sp. BL18I3N2]
MNERNIFEALSFLASRGVASSTEWSDFLRKQLEIDGLPERKQFREHLMKLSLVEVQEQNDNRVLAPTSAGREWLQGNGEAYGVENEEVEADEDLQPASVAEFGEDEEFPTHPYDVRKLRVTSINLSVFQTLRKIDKGEIVLRPSFQRAFVWDNVRQSRLIESLLIRIPLPAFYIDATDDERWEVVDGLQRLSTLHRFWKDELPLRGLQFLTELTGKTFTQLPNRYRILIEDNTQLLLYQLQSGTPAQAKFTIFSRLNTGGMSLTPQEIRHALYQGPATDLLDSIASSESFREATTGSVPTRRLEDRETVLRAVAFIDGCGDYRFADFDGFLSDTMERINKMSITEISSIEKRILLSLRKATILFDRQAFRKIYANAERRSSFNKALFEAWVSALDNHQLSDIEWYKSEIVESFINLIQTDSAFVRSITYGTGSVLAVRTRFQRVDDLLKGAVA